MGSRGTYRGVGSGVDGHFRSSWVEIEGTLDGPSVISKMTEMCDGERWEKRGLRG